MRYKFAQIAINSTAKKKPTEEDKTVYVGLEHIVPGDFFIKDYGSDVTPKGDKLLMKKGDVLFGKRRAYQRKVAIAPCDGIFSAHGMVLRPMESVVDKDFFPFFISSDQFMNEAIRISVGGLSPTINWKDLKECEFSLPPLSEQRVLADKLWAAYRLKEAYKKLIDATKDMVKAKFVEMFNGDYPTQTWKDCLSITNGKAYGEEYKEVGQYPIYGSGGIMGYGEKKFCPANTTILGRKGNINSPIFVSTDYWIVDTAFCLDVNKELLHPKYFYYWCTLFDFTRYNKQGVLPSLTKSDLLKIEMSIPPYSLQSQFVEIMDQSSRSLSTLRSALASVDSVMKSLINN